MVDKKKKKLKAKTSTFLEAFQIGKWARAWEGFQDQRNIIHLGFYC